MYIELPGSGELQVCLAAPGALATVALRPELKGVFILRWSQPAIPGAIAAVGVMDIPAATILGSALLQRQAGCLLAEKPLHLESAYGPTMHVVGLDGDCVEGVPCCEAGSAFSTVTVASARSGFIGDSEQQPGKNQDGKHQRYYEDRNLHSRLH